MTGRYNAVRASATLGASASETFEATDFTNLRGESIGPDEVLIVELALQANGGTRDLMIIGTVGA